MLDRTVPAVRVGTPLRVFWKVHRALMRATRGRFIAQAGPLPVLLLRATGRRSGKPRDVALNYIRDGAAYVVIASYAGEDRDPQWWKNLRAHADTEIIVGGRTLRVRATETEGQRRAALWERIIRADPAYAEYQQRTSRRIPVIALEPA